MCKKTKTPKLILCGLLSIICLSACGSDSSDDMQKNYIDFSAPVEKGDRDNTPNCLVPDHPGINVIGNELVEIDVSNASEGYVTVKYDGECSKVKFQIECPSSTTYTYLLTDGYEVFPLTTEPGTYTFRVYENIAETQYSTAFKDEYTVEEINPFGPYLYPNQYVNFNPDDKCVEKAEELAYPAADDLEVVARVYNYMIQNITYDTNLAQTVESGYLPNPDNTLASGTGICLDYSSLMAAMLRSQGIPAHMEVGYAGTAYHAWISVYLDETGWVNGIIEFNGTTWELMDPTFAASSSEKKLKEFIGNGNNYEVKYVY